jgi:hypothetical protein
MRFNLPIAILALWRTDKGYWFFQPPAAYLGDEQILQMLRILGLGVIRPPTVTELIFVGARFTSCAMKAFYALRTVGSSYCPQSYCPQSVKMLL